MDAQQPQKHTRQSHLWPRPRQQQPKQPHEHHTYPHAHLVVAWRFKNFENKISKKNLQKQNVFVQFEKSEIFQKTKNANTIIKSWLKRCTTIINTFVKVPKVHKLHEVNQAHQVE